MDWIETHTIIGLGERPLFMSTAVLPQDPSLYGDHDPRERPLYTFADASRAADVPASTVRSWIVGQRYRRKDDMGYFEPVIERPESEDGRLSFANLIEVHVLRALRTVHDVRLDSIREAVRIAQNELGIDRLLIDHRLKTSARKLFLDRYTDLLELSPSRQIAMRRILDLYLERIDYDPSRLPVEFYPFEKSPRNAGRKVISISPFVSFGRPLVHRCGVSTRAIVQRLDAGEAEDAVLQDYGLEEAELEEAILYEAAA